MKQLSLFEFTDEPEIIRAPVLNIPQERSAWWIELLRRPRDEWDDSDDGSEAAEVKLAVKQERIPGLA
jgi:hypothetical protein